MQQSKDSLEYSHYDTDKDPLKHSKDSFASSPINHLLSSGKPYSSYSSNQKSYKSPAIKISDEERDYSSSNRYKEYESALKASKEKDYLHGNSREDFYRKATSNPYKPYEDANQEKSMRYENEESFQKKYRDQLYSSAKKIRDTLEESVDEIEKRINQIEKEINSSLDQPKEVNRSKYGTIASNNSNHKLKENSPPLVTFKEREERKPRALQETGWSSREEKMLREMEALRKENNEIKQDVRMLMRRLEEEERLKHEQKDEIEKKSNSREKGEKPEKNEKMVKKPTKSNLKSFKPEKEFDIEKEIEILKTIDKIKRKIQRSIQDKLQKSKQRKSQERPLGASKKENIVNHIAKSRKDFLNQKYQGASSKNCDNCSKLLCRGIPTCICSCAHKK